MPEKNIKRDQVTAESCQSRFPSRHMCARRPTICSVCFCIWSTTSPYSNTRSIFVRIWSCRCVIYQPNRRLLASNSRSAILVAGKRGCLRTDVITYLPFSLCPFWYRNQATTTKNPRLLFRHLNFFSLIFKYAREACISLSHLLRARSGLIRGNVCLCRPKKHLNDTRISSLFTTIRTVNKRRVRASHGKRLLSCALWIYGHMVHNIFSWTRGSNRWDLYSSRRKLMQSIWPLKLSEETRWETFERSPTMLECATVGSSLTSASLWVPQSN